MYSSEFTMCGYINLWERVQNLLSSEKSMDGRLLTNLSRRYASPQTIRVLHFHFHVKLTGSFLVLLFILSKFLPDKLDHTPLTDPNFISSSLSRLPKELTQGEGAATGWRALGTRTDLVRYVVKDDSAFQASTNSDSVNISGLPTASLAKSIEVHQSAQ